MDYQDYLKFFAALIFVLSLMGGLAFVLKRIGWGQAGMISPAKKRLKIIEVLPLDARRKAIILQRDTTQHLVVLGPSGETIVETNIEAPKDDTKSKKN